MVSLYEYHARDPFVACETAAKLSSRALRPLSPSQVSDPHTNAMPRSPTLPSRYLTVSVFLAALHFRAVGGYLKNFVHALHFRFEMTRQLLDI